MQLLRGRKKGIRMSRIIISFFVTALAAFPVLGQQDVSGKIEGTVLDPSKAAVANAKVTLTNTDRNQVVRETATNTSGVFSAPAIPIGNYTLKVEATGFKTNTISGIVLNVHDDLKFNVTLEVGQINESITVTDQPTKVELS